MPKKENVGKCEKCGQKAELRPYGLEGENICFKCFTEGGQPLLEKAKEVLLEEFIHDLLKSLGTEETQENIHITRISLN